ncbi:MAG: alpha/beta hydrolase [Desulfobacteraceae bacterium]|nr:alpha/beta hydrolase [Desulfobacteraceae bacterium]
MKIVGLVLMAAVVLFAGLKFFSRKLLYFPTPVSNSRLAYLKKSFNQVQQIIIPIEKKGSLHGWLIQKDMENLPILFYFGGNAEEVSLNMEDFIQNLDANVVMVNYRGFGQSDGSPTEAVLKSDALVIYDTMVEKYSIKPSNVVAWGRSIGSSMASFLVVERGLGRLILTCPFDSIESVAANYYPRWLVGMVLKDKHRIIDFSPRIAASTLILASREDEVIPPGNTINLYDSLNCPKKMVYIDGAGHNTISGFDAYYMALNKFLAKENKALEE